MPTGTASLLVRTRRRTEAALLFKAKPWDDDGEARMVLLNAVAKVNLVRSMFHRRVMQQLLSLFF